MNPELAIDHQLRPGDIGYLIYLHGKRYALENGYLQGLEIYTMESMLESLKNFSPDKDRFWIARHNDTIVGSIALMNRGDLAQLRYFLIEPDYRGYGLGNRLMQLFIDFMHRCGYQGAYLWTTNELPAAAHLYRKFGFVLTEEVPSEQFGKHTIEQKYELRN